MADLSITITAYDAASRVMSGIGQNARGMGSALGNVASMAGGFVIGSALTQMPGILFDAAKAAAEDAASVAKLKTAVENTGVAWDAHAASINNVVNAGIKRGFSDSQTRDALAMMTAQTGSAEEAQKRLALAQDISRGAGIDLGTASKLLGKVTEENVNVLGRYGLAVSKGTTETELFAKIQEKFGGQADAFADSTAGKMEAFNLAMGELQESLGGVVLPLLTAMADILTEYVLPAVEEHVVPAFEAMGEVISSALETVMPLFFALVDAMQPVVDMISGVLGPAIEWLASVWTEHVGSIVSTVQGAFDGDIATAIQGLLARLGETVVLLIEKFAEWAGAFIDWIGPMIPGLLAELGGLLVSVLGWIVEQAPGVLAKLDAWGAAFVGWVGPRIGPLLVAALELLGALTTWMISTALPAIVSKLAQWGVAFLAWVAEKVMPGLPGVLANIGSGILDWIRNFAPNVNSAAQGFGSSLVDGFKSGLSGLTGMLQRMVQDALNAAKRVLGISSPSKAFAYLGEMSAAGYAQGLQQRGMSSPMSLGGFAGAAGVGMGGGGGGQINFHFHGPVYGAQDIRDVVMQATSDLVRQGRINPSVIRAGGG